MRVAAADKNIDALTTQKQRRRTSILRGAGNIDDTSCTLKRATHQLVEPIHAVGYPGSGNLVLISLVQALTGMSAEGSDVGVPPPEPYNYITYVSHELAHARTFSRLILLLRNPLKAIPSLCNFHYERVHLQKDLMGHHKVQAPMEFWIPFRDERFDEELTLWKNTVEYWVDAYDNKEESGYYRLVISFESLVDQYVGPLETTRLARFLNETHQVSTAPAEQMPCLWNKIVGQDDGQVRASRRREEGDDVMFTLEQLDKITQVLKELTIKYYESEFVHWFYHYQKDVNKERERLL